MSTPPLSWTFGRATARVIAVGIPLDIAISLPPLVSALNASASGRMLSVYIIGVQALAGLVAFGTSFTAVGYLPEPERAVWRRRLWAYPLIASVWLFLSPDAYRGVVNPRDPA